MMTKHIIAVGTLMSVALVMIGCGKEEKKPTKNGEKITWEKIERE